MTPCYSSNMTFEQIKSSAILSRKILQVLSSTYVFTLLIIGLMGNVITGVVVIRVRQKTKHNVLVLAACVSNSAYLITRGLFDFVLESGFFPHANIISFSDTTCAVAWFFALIFDGLYNALIVCLALERLWALCQPFKHRLITSNQCIFIIFGLLFMFGTMASPFLYFFGRNNGHSNTKEFICWIAADKLRFRYLDRFFKMYIILIFHGQLSSLLVFVSSIVLSVKVNSIHHSIVRSSALGAKRAHKDINKTVHILCGAWFYLFLTFPKNIYMYLKLQDWIDAMSSLTVHDAQFWKRNHSTNIIQILDAVSLTCPAFLWIIYLREACQLKRSMERRLAMYSNSLSQLHKNKNCSTRSHNVTMEKLNEIA